MMSNSSKFSLFYSLHSNLVLFKLDVAAYPFTVAGFTFQSGSIQIVNIDGDMYTAEVLYIPIWFYSNSKK